tara:strand:- start:4277 stop:4498 length:222 start_codon:yes stop_codon:yes gene_type:complete
MCTNVAYTKKEMEIIHAIYSIDPTVRISIKGKLENKYDYMYGGVKFLDSLPISWNVISDKIDEQREKKYNQSP